MRAAQAWGIVYRALLSETGDDDVLCLPEEILGDAEVPKGVAGLKVRGSPPSGAGVSSPQADGLSTRGHEWWQGSVWLWRYLLRVPCAGCWRHLSSTRGRVLSCFLTSDGKAAFVLTSPASLFGGFRMSLLLPARPAICLLFLI